MSGELLDGLRELIEACRDELDRIRPVCTNLEASKWHHDVRLVVPRGFEFDRTGPVKSLLNMAGELIQKGAKWGLPWRYSPQLRRFVDKPAGPIQLGELRIDVEKALPLVLAIDRWARAQMPAERPQTNYPVLQPARSKRRRKRRRQSEKKTVPLTQEQTEAVFLIGEHKGNIAAAARAAGKSRPAMDKLYKKALKKLGKGAVEKMKTQPLPLDKRGQVDVHGQLDVPANDETD